MYYDDSQIENEQKNKSCTGLEPMATYNFKERGSA